MNFILFYLLLGSLSYVFLMDLWYRKCYAKKEFYAPDSFNWWLGFFIAVIFYPIAVPIMTFKYLKDK